MRTDLDGIHVDRNSALKIRRKTAGDVDSLERCEVVVTEGNLLKLKFHKSCEVLTLSFHFGYWNCSGVP